MTEIDYLKCKLESTEKAFDTLHKRHIELLKQQGALEQENANLVGDKIRSLEEFEKCTDKLKKTILNLREENERLRKENARFKQMLENLGYKVVIDDG